MSGKGIPVLLVYILLNHRISAFLGELSYTADPPSGSVITAFEYQQHIEIKCEITEGGTVIDTLWALRTVLDMDGDQSLGSGDIIPEINIIPETDPRFSVEGIGNSTLIIDVFTPGLNETVILCRDGMFESLVANFTLRSTGSLDASGSGAIQPGYDLILNPQPGVISGFEGQENIEICCEIYDNMLSMRITPKWMLLTADDQAQGRNRTVIDPDNDERFIFELGDPEELEVEVLIPELNGSIITCHETATDEMEAVSEWTLDSFSLVITTDPPSGTKIVRSLHSQIKITCQVEKINSIFWFLVTQEQGSHTQITSNDTRFSISGESTETLTIVDFSEELNEAAIICQIPYHGDIHIGNFTLILAEQFPLTIPGVEEEAVSEDCNPTDTLAIRQEIVGYLRNKLSLYATELQD